MIVTRTSTTSYLLLVNEEFGAVNVAQRASSSSQ